MNKPSPNYLSIPFNLGIIVFQNGERVATIHTSEYLYAKQLLGNDPNPIFHYLTLTDEDKETFKRYFPNAVQNIEEVNNLIEYIKNFYSENNKTEHNSGPHLKFMLKIGEALFHCNQSRLKASGNGLKYLLHPYFHKLCLKLKEEYDLRRNNNPEKKRVKPITKKDVYKILSENPIITYQAMYVIVNKSKGDVFTSKDIQNFMYLGTEQFEQVAQTTEEAMDIS